MPDAEHAANAKARATQQVEKGNLSAATHAKIVAKADKILRDGKLKKPPKKNPAAASDMEDSDTDGM